MLQNPIWIFIEYFEHESATANHCTKSNKRYLLRTAGICIFRANICTIIAQLICIVTNDNLYMYNKNNLVSISIQILRITWQASRTRVICKIVRCLLNHFVLEGGKNLENLFCIAVSRDLNYICMCKYTCDCIRLWVIMLSVSLKFEHISK